MYGQHRCTLILYILILGLVSLEDRSLSILEVKSEAQGTSNNTLPSRGSQVSDVGNLTSQAAADVGNLTSQAVGNLTSEAADVGNLTSQAAADVGNLTSQAAADVGNLTSLAALSAQLMQIGQGRDSDPLSINRNASLTVHVNPTEITEDEETSIDVRGRLSNRSNLGLYELEIDLSDGNKSFEPYPHKTKTDAEGRFRYSDSVTLSKGDYYLIVSPTEQFGSGVNSTTHIQVRTPPITLEQVYQLAYQLVIVVPAFVGAIIFLPKWLFKKKQLKMLADIFLEIDNTYSKNKSDLREAEVQLENLRRRYLVLLGKGKLDESSFNLVERRILHLIGKD